MADRNNLTIISRRFRLRKCDTCRILRPPPPPTICDILDVASTPRKTASGPGPPPNSAGAWARGASSSWHRSEPANLGCGADVGGPGGSGSFWPRRRGRRPRSLAFTGHGNLTDSRAVAHGRPRKAASWPPSPRPTQVACEQNCSKTWAPAGRRDWSVCGPRLRPEPLLTHARGAPRSAPPNTPTRRNPTRLP